MIAPLVDLPGYGYARASKTEAERWMELVFDYLRGRPTLKRAVLLIQQTGMLDSINAIRGVAVEYSLPIVMMVGLLEKEPDVRPRQSKRYGVRIVEPILEAMGVEYHEIEQEADVGKIAPAIDAAYKNSKPVVLLIGQRPS